MSRQRPERLSALTIVLLLVLVGCASPTPVPTSALASTRATEALQPTEALVVTPKKAPEPTETPTSTPAPRGVLSPNDLAAFDFVAEKKVAAVPLAGMTLGIRWGDNPLYVKGYGYASREEAVPAEAATVYRIASLTKQFIAAATMQLVDQGKISLDDHIVKFLPEAPASWEEITVRHLLNHTSGIPDVEGLPLNLPQEELVTHLKDTPLSSQPGSQFRYGSSGYRLLCLIIERKSGLACDDYLQEHIFAPLGMDATFNCLQSFEGIAQGYRIAGRELQPVVQMPSTIFGSHGLCSTAGDLLTWQQALVEGRLVSEESYQEMVSPTTLSDGTTVPYGYGVGVGEGAIGHGGSTSGFRSWLVYYPEDDLALVLLSNTDVPPNYALETLGTVIATRILAGSNE